LPYRQTAGLEHLGDSLQENALCHGLFHGELATSTNPLTCFLALATSHLAFRLAALKAHPGGVVPSALELASTNLLFVAEFHFARM
jgi:hypothetical protein